MHKFKLIPLLAVLASTTSLAQTKTIDFYSTNGNNRYVVEGTIEELKIPYNDKTLLLKNGTPNTYLTLNKEKPYHLRFLQNEISPYEIVQENKGKMVNYNNESVKLVNSFGDKVVIEYKNQLLFVPIEKISFPNDFFNDLDKGLKATFTNNIKPNDSIYMSQLEEGLSYNNSYQANIVSDNTINITQYLNINNHTRKTFDDVSLNFFFSDTNIKRNFRTMMKTANIAVAASPELASDMASPPSFEQKDVKDLKLISITKPVTIFPNFNKIKYQEKNYTFSEFVTVSFTASYEYYAKEITDNQLKVYEMESKHSFLNSNHNFINMISINIGKDIFPNGNIDIYDKVDGKEKLIISTNIGTTENTPVLLEKNRNIDLKIVDVNFKHSSFTRKDDYKINLAVENFTLKNNSDKDYILNYFDVKYKIPANQTVRVVIDK